jgi:hypothetical protein
VYNISAVAYHGGKLNGVNCLTGAVTKKSLMLVTYTMIFSVMLDFAASKLRLKNGEPGDKDYQVWEKCLEKLNDLWGLAQLNFTPKMQSICIILRTSETRLKMSKCLPELKRGFQ